MYYPDTIIVSWKTEPVPTFILDDYGNPTDIPTGDYSPGEDHTFTSDCRCVVSNSAKKVFGQDGSKVDYQYDVYMPKTDVVIPDFVAEYVLTQEDGKTLKGTVKTSKNNIFNSRIWL